MSPIKLAITRYVNGEIFDYTFFMELYKIFSFATPEGTKACLAIYNSVKQGIRDNMSLENILRGVLYDDFVGVVNSPLFPNSDVSGWKE